MKRKELSTKFTVIIPTRDRCDTLRWALKTCVEQNYENLEIVVSDNFSQDETREVVDSYSDSRIKYVNTGKRLSMTDNYEFALSHATGDYITLIGDDDGMIPNVFDEVSEIIDELHPSILTWEKAFYTWGNYFEESARDTLSLPYRRKNQVKKIDAAAFLHSTCAFENRQTSICFGNEFPAIYHGLASRETIKKARSADGTFFNSRIPDIYSGVALCSVTQEYWHSTKPFSVRGCSSHSIGDAQFSGNDGKASPATKFLQEVNLPFHPKMGFCYNLPIMMIESLLQVRDNVPNARNTDFDVRLLVDKAMDEAATKPQNIYDDTVKAVRHVGKVFDVENYAERAIMANTHSPAPPPPPVIHGYHPLIKSYIFDGRKYEIENVFDAGKFCEKVLSEYSLADLIKNNLLYVYNAVTKRGIRQLVS